MSSIFVFLITTGSIVLPRAFHVSYFVSFFFFISWIIIKKIPFIKFVHMLCINLSTLHITFYFIATAVL